MTLLSHLTESMEIGESSKFNNTDRKVIQYFKFVAWEVLVLEAQF